uniref:Uncharacterized protein n=1 Tax=Anguilla anguilla TaxID=7936 RepID=A0A0E9VZU7_ANGAN
MYVCVYIYDSCNITPYYIADSLSNVIKGSNTL